MRVAIVDVWGDGEGCLWVEDCPQLDVVIDEWRELDKGYMADVVTELEWMGIEEYLALHGIRLLQARVIVL